MVVPTSRESNFKIAGLLFNSEKDVLIWVRDRDNHESN